MEGRLAVQAGEEAEAALQVATAAELEFAPLVLEVFSELVQEAVQPLPLQKRLRGSCGGPFVRFWRTALRSARWHSGRPQRRPLRRPGA